MGGGQMMPPPTFFCSKKFIFKDIDMGFSPKFEFGSFTRFRENFF